MIRRFKICSVFSGAVPFFSVTGSFCSFSVVLVVSPVDFTPVHFSSCLLYTSLRLAKTISEEAVKHNCEIPILIEVNVAGEESKFGVSVEETLPLIEEIAKHTVQWS